MAGVSPPPGPPCRPCVLGRCSGCLRPADCPCFSQQHVQALAGLVPRACGACADRVKITPHCVSPRCTWVRCPTCRVVTGLPGGQLRTMASP